MNITLHQEPIRDGSCIVVKMGPISYPIFSWSGVIDKEFFQKSVARVICENAVTIAADLIEQATVRP